MLKFLQTAAMVGLRYEKYPENQWGNNEYLLTTANLFVVKGCYEVLGLC